MDYGVSDTTLSGSKGSGSTGGGDLSGTLISLTGSGMMVGRDYG